MEFANILQSCSVIFASFSVAMGVHAWRREYIGKRRIELAEEVLMQFYEARDAIRRIRSPFGFLGEGKTRQQNNDESEVEKRILDKAYVVVERRDKEHEVFNKLQVSRYRFMARFGSAAIKPFEDINKLINQIMLSAHTLGTYYWREEHRSILEGEARTKFNEERHRLEAVLMEGLVKPDSVNSEVESVVEIIEEICRPVVHPTESIFLLQIGKT